MINNRQPGRRRGRNNSRPQGNGRGGDQGNRIDNRARGNAAQLLEKYKNLARDAQTQGDRVNTEYYLQFADHYFRVLADNRTRQEEQQSWRRDRDDNRYGDDEEAESDLEQGVGEELAAQDEVYRPQQRYNERQTEPRNDRPHNDRPHNDRQHERPNERQGERQFERRPRRPRDDEAAPVQADAEARPAVQPQPVATEETAPKVKRAPRQKRAPRADATEESHGLDAAILPPSISRADNDSGEEEAAPRKRTRRVRPAAEAAE